MCPPKWEITVAEKRQELVPGEVSVLHLPCAVHLQQPNDGLGHLITIITNLKTYDNSNILQTQFHSVRVASGAMCDTLSLFHKAAE